MLAANRMNLVLLEWPMVVESGIAGNGMQPNTRVTV
jgi:hypothetical protein